MMGLLYYQGLPVQYFGVVLEKDFFCSVDKSHLLYKGICSRSSAKYGNQCMYICIMYICTLCMDEECITCYIHQLYLKFL